MCVNPSLTRRLGLRRESVKTMWTWAKTQGMRFEEKNTKWLITQGSRGANAPRENLIWLPTPESEAIRKTPKSCKQRKKEIFGEVAIISTFYTLHQLN